MRPAAPLDVDVRARAGKPVDRARHLQEGRARVVYGISIILGQSGILSKLERIEDMLKTAILAFALFSAAPMDEVYQWQYACYAGDKYVGIFSSRQAGLNCILL